MTILESAANGKKRCGKREYIKYLQNIRLTRNQAIKAKCFDCDGMGETGICEIDTCALFPYSPYNKSEKEVGNAF